PGTEADGAAQLLHPVGRIGGLGGADPGAGQARQVRDARRVERHPPQLGGERLEDRLRAPAEGKARVSGRRVVAISRSRSPVSISAIASGGPERTTAAGAFTAASASRGPSGGRSDSAGANPSLAPRG